MKLPFWFKSMFEAESFQNLRTDDLLIALADSNIRRHWLETVLDEVRDINLRTHTAVLNGELSKRFEQESGRLQGLDWALRQILNSKTSVELDRHHNHTDDPHAGVAVRPV